MPQATAARDLPRVIPTNCCMNYTRIPHRDSRGPLPPPRQLLCALNRGGTGAATAARIDVHHELFKKYAIPGASLAQRLTPIVNIAREF